MLQGINIEGFGNTALATFVRSQFKGTCNQHGGVYGYKGVDCNIHPGNKGKYAGAEKQKFMGECHYCGILGHNRQTVERESVRYRINPGVRYPSSLNS